MDNLYRFGSVEVVCEGYDYPDDPYILKGSCGLEYTLELTKEGQNKNQGIIQFQPIFRTPDIVPRIFAIIQSTFYRLH